MYGAMPAWCLEVLKRATADVVAMCAAIIGLLLQNRLLTSYMVLYCRCILLSSLAGATTFLEGLCLVCARCAWSGWTQLALSPRDRNKSQGTKWLKNTLFLQYARRKRFKYV